MTDRADFRASHVYSTAPSAAAKRDIDRQIMSGDYSAGSRVRLDNASYLRDLVRKSASGVVTARSASGREYLKAEAEWIQPLHYRLFGLRDTNAVDISPFLLFSGRLSTQNCLPIRGGRSFSSRARSAPYRSYALGNVVRAYFFGFADGIGRSREESP